MVVHPYWLVGIAWCVLGISTGIAAMFEFARVHFVVCAWISTGLLWDTLQRCEPSGDRFWWKMHARVVWYARIVFLVWLGALTHQLLWWEMGHMTLDETHSMVGWGLSGVVLACSALSFLPVKPLWRRCAVWVMICAGFAVPPWRKPWYTEAPVLLQVRWVVVALLFLVQACENYGLNQTYKRAIGDLYVLRVCWVPLVQPTLLLFAFGCLLYYVFTMFRIRIETTLPMYQETPPQQQPLSASQPAQIMLPPQYGQPAMYYTSQTEFR